MVPHLICGGFNRMDTEDALFDLMFLVLKNVLALRGDPRKGQEHFMPEQFGHSNAGELVKQVKDMKESHYLHALVPMNPSIFALAWQVILKNTIQPFLSKKMWHG